MGALIEIRRELRAGDLGAIIEQHGRLYAREYGLDASFEAHVASSVARAGLRGWPRDADGIWIVEREGKHAGSLALTDEGSGEATLRWFLLDPAVRGMGLGKSLVGELLVKAEAVGCERLGLETFSELRAAARLYRAHGFEVVWAETGPRWGRPELTYQRYEVALPSRVEQRVGELHRVEGP